MTRALPILIFAGVAAVAPTVSAMNLMPLLQDTPAQLFTSRDYELFDGALRSALNETRQDGVVQWSNPDSRAAGSVTVLKEYERRGESCKRLRVESQANNRKAQTIYEFCRQADGRWVLAPPHP